MALTQRIRYQASFHTKFIPHRPKQSDVIVYCWDIGGVFARYQDRLTQGELKKNHLALLPTWSKRCKTKQEKEL